MGNGKHRQFLTVKLSSKWTLIMTIFCWSWKCALNTKPLWARETVDLNLLVKKFSMTLENIGPKLVELHTEEEEQVSEILHKVRIIVSMTLCTVHKTYHVYKTLVMEQHPEIDWGEKRILERGLKNSGKEVMFKILCCELQQKCRANITGYVKRQKDIKH